ncbi:amino acid permease [Halorussus sp. GCM10023401]|uniref:amino acid permease n=1 Tax=Halorussus TaxID=1070314 RepID=UPI00209CFDFC|nr:amino acid permease [Halorussus vallis]USZ76015.1 amino acid permease [Halorussus vallis]
MAEDSSHDVAAGEGTGEGEVETELSRDMSLFDITFIGVGAMIGAGVFALTGFAAGLAGPALTLAFLLNGFVAMFTAVSYAELGAAFPEAGGGYLWVKEALVDPNGFYAGWMSWFAHAVACSLYAVTFGVFLVELIIYATGLPHEFHLLGFITPIMAEKGLSVVMVAAFAYINYRGAEETGKAGVIVTGIKVVILGAFIAFGVYATVTAPQWTDKFFNSPSFAPNGLFGIIGAMGFTYIAFEGYEIIVQSGEEVVDPGKNVPKAVFYSMAIVVPIYILVAFASIGGIDVTQRIIGLAEVSGQQNIYTWELLGELGELGIIRAAGQFMPYGVPLLLFAGLAATMSALNATVYSSSRVSFAMGRDRALPGSFDKIHPEKRTPHWAIFVSAILIAAMAVVLPIEAVAASADIMFILLFVQVNWTVVRMRQTHPDLPRTYEVPFMPWPPLIGIGLQILLTPFLIYTLGLEAFGIGESNHGLIALVATAVWMGLGLVVYYGYSKQQEAEQIEEDTPTLLTEATPSNAENQIVVPIANPENADQLMRTAVDLAKDRDGEILAMSVVTVPQQTPTSEGRKFVTDERETLDHAMDIAREANVPVSGTIRIGHDIAEAILNTANQYDSDAILMGWKGQHKSQRRDIILGSNVDRVVQEAHCDVMVERVAPDATGEVDRILVPTAGGPHAEYAEEIADAIAYAQNAEVDVVHVIEPGASEQDRNDAQALVDDAADTFREDVTVTGEVVEGSNVVDTIIERSASYNLVVVGATREGLLDQFVFGAIPEQIGRQAQDTVIMAKRNLGITSKVRRWFGSK